MLSSRPSRRRRPALSHIKRSLHYPSSRSDIQPDQYRSKHQLVLAFRLETYSLDCTPLDVTPHRSSMSSTREQIPPRRKRQRTEAGLSLDESSEPRPSKRRESSIKLHSAEFYDSLSKVWLTRRALKELDRRTNQVSRPQRPVSAPPHVYRVDNSKQVQRFARRGGPELRDLRGVRPVSKACWLLLNLRSIQRHVR